MIADSVCGMRIVLSRGVLRKDFRRLCILIQLLQFWKDHVCKCEADVMPLITRPRVAFKYVTAAFCSGFTYLNKTSPT